MTERALKAIEFNTLPEFIFKMKHEPFYRNFESDITTFGFENPKNVVYGQINPNAELPLDLSDSDIFKFYILSNVNFLNFIATSDYKLAILSFGLSESEARLFDDIFFQIHGDQKMRADLINEIIYEREEFRQSMLEKKTEYDELTESKPWNILKQTEISKNIIYELEINNTLLGIFDSIVTDSEMPLVTCSNYYKKYRGYQGLIEYPESKKELLIFINGIRILFREETVDFLRPIYTVILPVEQDIFRVLSKFINIKTIKPKGNVLNLEFSMGTDVPVSLHLNKVIWAEICMNSILSDNFAIDESERASKQYMSIYSWWIKDKNRVSFQLREDMQFNSLLKRQEYSIVARVYNIPEDRGHVEEFQSYLVKALGYYYAVAARLAKVYNELLSQPILLDIVNEKDKQKVRLKNISSEIFVAGYPRMCQFTPSVVSLEEKIVLEDEGFHIMHFPKDSPRSLLFSCAAQKQHIFPGLKVNRLANKDSYPLVPCCFKEDQREKKSYYKQYYQGEQRAKPEVSRILLTEKLVKFSQLGKLPADINSYLSSLGDTRARRQGVLHDKGSIIDCILESIDKSHRKKSEVARRKTLYEIRKSIETYYFNYCRQETITITLDDSISIFRNIEEFIDVSMYYTLLEKLFHCRLVVFSRSDFKRPYFVNGFVHATFSTTWPVVIVYENFGSKTERLDYPQYELIETRADPERVYADYMSSFITWKIRKSRLIPYSNDSDEKETIHPSSLESQILDVNGKVAAINVKIGNQVRTFYLFDHCPPLGVPITLDLFHSDSYTEECLEIQGLGIIKGYFTSSGDKNSILEQFIQTRTQAKALIEQAKYLYSKFGQINFKEVAQPNIPTNSWLTTNSLEVNQNSAERVMYVVKLFETQRPAELRDFSKLSFIPYSFDSILDFTQRPNCDIGETGTELVSGADFKLDSPRGQERLFIKADDEVFFCSRVSKIPDNIAVRVFFWKTREVLVMPEHEADLLFAGQFVYQMQKIR